VVLVLAGCGREEPAAHGVVVESLGRGGAAARAGMRPGDLLLAWESGGRSRAIRSPFDLVQAEIDVAPVRPLRLRGRREAQDLTFALPPVEWKLYARPALPPDPLRRYQEARILASPAGRPPRDPGADLSAAAAPGSRLRLSLGAACLSAGQSHAAYAALQAGKPARRRLRSPGRARATRCAQRLDAPKAARPAPRGWGPRPLAASLVTLARLAQYRGDLDAAEPLWRRSWRSQGEGGEPRSRRGSSASSTLSHGAPGRGR
jgi:hypothetical protein